MQVFKVDDVVIYGNNGACRIECIEQRDDGDYYILVPVHKDRTKLLVPAQNEVLVSRMRALPEEKVLRAALNEALEAPLNWISDNAARKEHAKQVLKDGTETELLVLVRTFYDHRRRAVEAGKKTSSSDAALLRAAQDRVRDEFSLVFNIAPDEVDSYIAKLVE